MIVHSFVNIIPLINNTPGEVSPIGELSPNSSTFSRELGNYSTSQYDNVKLITFLSQENEQAVELPIGLRNTLLEIADWTYSLSRDGSFTSDSSDFKQIFSTQYPYDIDEMGRMEKVGNVYYPTYFVFSKDGEQFSLWFSDKEFDKEYPEYDMFPIMPVDDLDALHGTRADVFDLLDNISLTDIFNRIDEVKQELPFTHQYPLEVNWVDKNDPDVTKRITFTELIYGNAGKNIDLIKESLVNYILSNSSYSRAEWEVVLPELFLPNEFYITPLWNELAVENLQSYGGVYSCVADMDMMMKYAISTFHGLSTDFISFNVEHAVSIYSSIGFVALGNEKNQTGTFKFSEQWPEFSTVSTFDGYFDRLSPSTREFMTELTKALIYAERWDGVRYVNLPNDYSLIERGGNTYIVFSFEKVSYLVSVRSNEISEPELVIGDGDVIIDDGPGMGGGFIGSPVFIECLFAPNEYDTTGMVVRLMEVNPETGESYPYEYDGSVYWHIDLYNGPEIHSRVEGERADGYNGGEAIYFEDLPLDISIWNAVVTARFRDFNNGSPNISQNFSSENNSGPQS
jgi:hypothetical protein